MPELPEVETIVNDLKLNILKKRIAKIQIFLPKILKGSSTDFITTLQNNIFINIQRRAKFLIFTLASGEKLLIHLRMTGQLIFLQKQKIIAGGHGDEQDLTTIPNKHTHIIINFADGSQLFYNDLRQFGFLKLVRAEALEQEFKNFGIEPLSKDFTLAVFKKLISKHKGNIKAFLLNQKYVAGLGNIYTDEVLFTAQVLPTRKIDSLSPQEIKKIYLAIKNILKQAIKYRGTTFNNYRDASGRKGNFSSLLKVYSRVGQNCLRCKQGIIKKKKIGGRSASYCDFCQF